MAVASAPTQVSELKTVVNLLINVCSYCQMEIYSLLVESCFIKLWLRINHYEVSCRWH